MSSTTCATAKGTPPRIRCSAHASWCGRSASELDLTSRRAMRGAAAAAAASAAAAADADADADADDDDDDEEEEEEDEDEEEEEDADTEAAAGAPAPAGSAACCSAPRPHAGQSSGASQTTTSGRPEKCAALQAARRASTQLSARPPAACARSARSRSRKQSPSPPRRPHYRQDCPPEASNCSRAGDSYGTVGTPRRRLPRPRPRAQQQRSRYPPCSKRRAPGCESRCRSLPELTQSAQSRRGPLSACRERPPPRRSCGLGGKGGVGGGGVCSCPGVRICCLRASTACVDARRGASIEVPTISGARRQGGARSTAD